MSFLNEYGLFLLKTATIAAAVIAVIVAAGLVGSRMVRSQRPGRRGLQVKNLNRAFDDLAFALRSQTMPGKVAKAEAKARRKQRKAEAKGTAKGNAEGTAEGTAAGTTEGTAEGTATGTTEGTAQGRGTAAAPAPPATTRPRVYVLDFHGDVRASEVAALREEISAVVAVARPGDEVVVRLENPGGLIADQGLAAAQLMRLRARGLRLVVTVDKVAASGGYMMACVADRILAAPFAVVGSIGVITEIPNVYRLLDRSGIEFEQVTGGEFKRTITPFTQTTPEKRAKLTEQVQDIHALFKEFVAQQRPQLDVERVGTGEYWYGSRAVELGLVDELVTSDDYLMARTAEADLYAVSWAEGRTPAKRLAALVQVLAGSLSGTARGL